MANETITIRRVYLKQKHFHQSMHHTAYAYAPELPDMRPGIERAIVTLRFDAGIAYDVPQTLYDLFASLGIATTERPKRPWELEEEQERGR